MTAIVDYQAGNIGSIRNMLKRMGHESVITSSTTDLMKAQRIILPGVGSFDYGMQKLGELGLIEALTSRQKEGAPILGICLGAQLMCLGSEEGKLAGLGWIDAEVKRFPRQQDGRKYTVPHMGWEVVVPLRKSRLFDDVDMPARFYFVHSYYIHCKQTDDVLAECNYSTRYHAAFEHGNTLGVQYHPEKSHKFGKQLLRNFVEKY